MRSMTGFGRASFQLDELPCDVEVRSVNHRYRDVRVRLPRLRAAFEGDARAEIQARFGRGTSIVTGSPTSRLGPHVMMTEDLTEGQFGSYISTQMVP